eukprot:COSAG04_NODE_5429_length_1623_cov_1.477690_1_plen_131_part_00
MPQRVRLRQQRDGVLEALQTATRSSATAGSRLPRGDNALTSSPAAARASAACTAAPAPPINDRVDLSKEFLSEGFLNFSLILVNILVPLGVVVEQIYRNNAKKGDAPTTKTEEGTEIVNPLGIADGDAKD